MITPSLVNMCRKWPTQVVTFSADLNSLNRFCSNVLLLSPRKKKKEKRKKISSNWLLFKWSAGTLSAAAARAIGGFLAPAVRVMCHDAFLYNISRIMRGGKCVYTRGRVWDSKQRRRQPGIIYANQIERKPHSRPLYLSLSTHPKEKKKKKEGEMGVCPSATSILHHHHHLFLLLLLLGGSPAATDPLHVSPEL